MNVSSYAFISAFYFLIDLNQYHEELPKMILKVNQNECGMDFRLLAQVF